MALPQKLGEDKHLQKSSKAFKSCAHMGKVDLFDCHSFSQEKIVTILVMISFSYFLSAKVALFRPNW